MIDDPENDELETARVHCRYEVDCPYCQECNDCGDGDPSGETLTCEYCGLKFLASN